MGLHDFPGLNNYQKILKIVLPLSYHMMSLHKNLGFIWKKVDLFHNFDLIFNKDK